MSSKDLLLQKIREGGELTRRDQLHLVAALSVPAMLSQLSTIIMEYIDASMVGSLGAQASAAIGLVSTSIWLIGGLSHSVSAGFYVQVAHQIGANRFTEARNIVRQSLVCALIFSMALGITGICISPYLPSWLGGAPEIQADASIYFAVSAGMLPFMIFMALGGGMLRCSGNIKIPSLLNVVACALDVVFNYIFIFRFHMGVKGAAIGSACAYGCAALVMLWYLIFRSPELHLQQDPSTKRDFRPQRRTLSKWWRISLPMGIEHGVMCLAQIFTTIIIAPLGTIAIAAHAFGIIIEGLCYMPGHGIADAATTLVGQSLGAKRLDLTRSFARYTVFTGIAVMSLMGTIMYLFAPEVMNLMTPDLDVQQLATRVLRIEAFAEPMYAASIVCYGVFIGAGDTFVPCAMNLGSMWVIRISLALICTKVLGLGLVGVWTAMAIELCFRGLIFFGRVRSQRWTK